MIPKMAKFVFSLLLIASMLATISSSSLSLSSLKSKKREFVSKAAGRSPYWFTKSSDGVSEDSWNIYGKWFNQKTSKPSGGIVHLGSVGSTKDFWRLVSPAKINSLDRVDISLFRPGLEPDFSKFVNHKTGYILSYKVNEGLKSNPKKIIGKTSSEAELISSQGSLAHYQIFDALISIAIASSFEPSGLFASAIMGITFSKKYDVLIVQIFVDGSLLKFRIAEEAVQSLVSAANPEASLGPVRKYRLSDFSFHLASSANKFKPSSVAIKPLGGSESAKIDSAFIQQEVTEERYGARNEETNDEKSVQESAEETNDERVAPVFEVNNSVIDEDEASLNYFKSSSSSLDSLQSFFTAADDFSSEIDDLGSDQFENCEGNEEIFQSNYSVEAAAPNLLRTLEEELFEIIFTVPFDIFNQDHTTICSNFNAILNTLKERRAAQI